MLMIRTVNVVWSLPFASEYLKVAGMEYMERTADNARIYSEIEILRICGNERVFRV